MPNRDFLTDEELDALLAEAPVFDPQAVKRRVLAELAAGSKQAPTAKKTRHIGRGLLLAAAICVLSVSCLAVADYASGGRIAAALGIAPAVKVEEVSSDLEETACVPAAVSTSDSKAVEPVEEEPAPAGADLGSEFTDVFAFTPAQTTLLRPAAQNVNQTAVNQNIKMTVLQTLGDSRYLYITVRFDFPENVPVDTTYDFQDMDFLVNGESVRSWTSSVAACAAHSVTYLIAVQSDTPLNGQRVTLSYRDYGRCQTLPEGYASTCYLPARKFSTVEISPTGTSSALLDLGDVTVTIGKGADASSAPEVSREEYPEHGCTVVRRSDGSASVTCDGTKGRQWLMTGDGSPVPISFSASDPLFETLCAGTWEQSWTLSYQNLSKTWSGMQNIFDPNLSLINFRISPLSCSMEFAGTLLSDDPDAAIPYVHDMETVLVLADGSTRELPLHLSAWSSHTEEDGSYIADTEVKLSSPIDLTNVTAVILDGVTFPLT